MRPSARAYTAPQREDVTHARTTSICQRARDHRGVRRRDACRDRRGQDGGPDPHDERDDGVNQKAPTAVLWPSMMDNFAGDQTFIQRSVTILVRSGRTGSS